MRLFISTQLSEMDGSLRVKPSYVEDAWNNLKDCLLSGVDKVVKQRVIECITRKLGGGTIQLMLLKRNEKNGSSGN